MKHSLTELIKKLCLTIEGKKKDIRRYFIEALFSCIPVIRIILPKN